MNLIKISIPAEYKKTFMIELEKRYNNKDDGGNLSILHSIDHDLNRKEEKLTPEIIKDKILSILILFDISSQLNFKGDSYRFFKYFVQMLHESLSLFSLVLNNVHPWDDPPNVIKTLDNEFEKKYISMLFPSISIEDANKNKKEFKDWFIDLLERLQDKFDKEVIMYPLSFIDDFLNDIIRRDYLRNFRPVNGTRNLFRSPEISNYIGELDLLEDFFRKNDIRLVIDLRGPEEEKIHEKLVTLLEKLNIERIVANLTTLPDGRRIGPSYAKRAKTLKSEIGMVFKKMISTDGAMIFHCASGKDRTGIIAALFQKLAGVDEEEIKNDYVLSGLDTRKQRIEELLDYINNLGGIENYLQECGVSIKEQEEIKKKIII
ncbi:MAG: tyrosine-protein phosphatase [Promethearchaeota archaeon]